MAEHKDADREQQKLQHLTGPKLIGIGELGENGQRGDRETYQLKESCDCVHRIKLPVAPVTDKPVSPLFKCVLKSYDEWSLLRDS